MYVLIAIYLFVHPFGGTLPAYTELFESRQECEKRSVVIYREAVAKGQAEGLMMFCNEVD